MVSAYILIFFIVVFAHSLTINRNKTKICLIYYPFAIIICNFATKLKVFYTNFKL